MRMIAKSFLCSLKQVLYLYLFLPPVSVAPDGHFSSQHDQGDINCVRTILRSTERDLVHNQRVGFTCSAARMMRQVFNSIARRQKCVDTKSIGLQVVTGSVSRGLPHYCRLRKIEKDIHTAEMERYEPEMRLK
jgi:hypothetical protein